MAGGREKRKANRATVHLRMTLVDGHSSKFKMDISDVSASGFALDGTARLAVGRLYRFDFAAPDGEQVSGSLRVRWEKDNHYIRSYGAEIEAIDSASRRRLDRLMAREFGHRVDRPIVKPLVAAALFVFLLYQWATLIERVGWLVAGLGILIAGAYSGWLLVSAYRA